MSKSFKKIASIALPVIGTLVAPGIGTALGSSLSSAALGAAGGAIGGAAGGAISGGGIKGIATGAALGGVGGYVAGSGGIGNAAGNILNSTGNGTAAYGLLDGAASGGGGFLGGLGGIGGGSGGLTSISNLSTLANLASGISGAGAAKDAARIQSDSVNRALTAQTEAEQRARADLQPYVDNGQAALPSYQNLVNDPNAQANFINNNPFYKSLADDAEKRLLANQAARGKVGSGGTAKSLQNQLTLLGNQLVQQQVGNLQNQVTLGQNAASRTGSNTLQTGNALSGLYTDQGAVNAAGKVGAANAYTNSAQSGINSLISLEALKNPYYGSTVYR